MYALNGVSRNEGYLKAWSLSPGCASDWLTALEVSPIGTK